LTNFYFTINLKINLTSRSDLILTLLESLKILKGGKEMKKIITPEWLYTPAIEGLIFTIGLLLFPLVLFFSILYERIKKHTQKMEEYYTENIPLSEKDDEMLYDFLIRDPWNLFWP